MTLDDAGWLCAFVVSLVVVLAASDRLVRAVEAAGDRFSLPPGLVGLIAAAGADGPEVTAAIISLIKGRHDVSLGVIVGSNLFNLAALLGLPILLVGSVAVRRHGLLLNGGVMVLVTALAALLVVGGLPVRVLDPLVLAVLVAYGVLLVLPYRSEPNHGSSPLPGARPEPGDGAAEEREREREEDVALGFPSPVTLLLVGVLATATVIGGCTVLVSAALYLGPWLHLSNGWTGTFGLAILTSLPNVWVALALARRRRGAVLMSAVCNSNTINVAFGICLPALFITVAPSSIVRHLDLPAMLGLSLLAIGLVWRDRGLGRGGAACLVVLYLGFAVLRTLLG